MKNNSMRLTDEQILACVCMSASLLGFVVVLLHSYGSLTASF